ncbi:MAG: SIMPL domain-containing protein [Dehalococcoidia bacterium]
MDRLAAYHARLGQLFGRTSMRIGTVIAVLLTVGMAVSSQAQTAPPPLPDSITVSGQATVSQPPDLATVFGSVLTQADTPAAAVDQNSRTLQQVIDAVTALGVSQDDIVTSGFNVSPQYSYTQPQPGQPSQPPTIIGYQAVNGLTVNTKQLTQASAILQALASAGATNVSGPSYGLQHPEELQRQALTAAAGDALQNAQGIVRVLGVRLGDVLSVTEGFNGAVPIARPPALQPATPFPAATAGAFVAPPPVLPPSSLSANAAVTVVFALINPAPAGTPTP